MKKLIFVIITALLLSLCGCVLTDITETSESDDIRAIDLSSDPAASEVILTNEVETEDTSELVIVTTADTDTESAVAETTVSETTTLETTANETTAEDTTEPKQDGLTITYVTSPVNRNETATVNIKGKPNTEYKITVYYSTAASKASGLENKTSGSDGLVSWSWKVGGKTNSGTFRIVISGGGESVETQFTVN